MAVDPRKRQKQQQKKTAKRKAKLHEVRTTALQASNPATALANIEGSKILRCWAANSLDSGGMGQVGVARSLPNGMVVFGSFLIDRYCLGVKDSFVQIVPKIQFANKILPDIRGKAPFRDITPANARRFVEDAIAYAHSLGFEPHPDYHKAKRVLDDIDVSESTETLEFGKNGKPFYMSGPYDDTSRILRILAENKNLGPAGYDVIAAIGGSELDE